MYENNDSEYDEQYPHVALHKLLGEMYLGRNPSAAAKKDFFSRELVVTPFDGAYGRAGFVIAVNGSPPRGVMVSLEGDSKSVPPAIFFLEMDKSRRVGDAQAKIVRRFLDSWGRE